MASSFSTCTPRGRWIKAKYYKTHGRSTSQLAYLYEVVMAGSGVPSSGAYAILPGDIIVASDVENGLVSMGEKGDVYIHYDVALLAKWNPVIDEPVVLYSSIYGYVSEFKHEPGVSWDGDALEVEVVSVDGTSIYDISPGDKVLVPKRFVHFVGERPNTRVLFRAEHVLATC